MGVVIGDGVAFVVGVVLGVAGVSGFFGVTLIAVAKGECKTAPTF